MSTTIFGGGVEKQCTTRQFSTESGLGMRGWRVRGDGFGAPLELENVGQFRRGGWIRGDCEFWRGGWIRGDVFRVAAKPTTNHNRRAATVDTELKIIVAVAFAGFRFRQGFTFHGFTTLGSNWRTAPCPQPRIPFSSGEASRNCNCFPFSSMRMKCFSLASS